jgi:hypothetical protein
VFQIHETNSLPPIRKLSPLNQPTADNGQRTTDNRQQTTDNRQQTTDNLKQRQLTPLLQRQ